MRPKRDVCCILFHIGLFGFPLVAFGTWLLCAANCLSHIKKKKIGYLPLNLKFTIISSIIWTQFLNFNYLFSVHLQYIFVRCKSLHVYVRILYNQHVLVCFTIYVHQTRTRWKIEQYNIWKLTAITYLIFFFSFLTDRSGECVSILLPHWWRTYLIIIIE